VSELDVAATIIGSVGLVLPSNLLNRAEPGLPLSCSQDVGDLELVNAPGEASVHAQDILVAGGKLHNGDDCVELRIGVAFVWKARVLENRLHVHRRRSLELTNHGAVTFASL
jgi:hypothetical protein